MALLDIIIETLRINCSVVQCSGYASDIEALFYLFFFPTVFIILFIYIVVGVVLDKAGGKEGGLRLLVCLALYAFIVFQGYYNLFVSLSRLWWILLATLAGLWIFIRTMIHGRGGSGGSPMPSIGSGFRKLARAADLDIETDLLKQAGNINDMNRIIGLLKKKIETQKKERDQLTSEREKHAYDINISKLNELLDEAEIKLKSLKKGKKVNVE